MARNNLIIPGQGESLVSDILSCPGKGKSLAFLYSVLKPSEKELTIISLHLEQCVHSFMEARSGVYDGVGVLLCVRQWS
jgi:hypothetical protein